MSIDVEADASMLTSHHVLWNIGNDQVEQHWFANVRGPRSRSPRARRPSATCASALAGRGADRGAVTGAVLP